MPSYVSLTCFYEIEPRSHEDEAELIERGTGNTAAEQTQGDIEISWLRFLGNSRYRREARRYRVPDSSTLRATVNT